jgi:hypothetical protein
MDYLWMTWGFAREATERPGGMPISIQALAKPAAAKPLTLMPPAALVPLLLPAAAAASSLSRSACLGQRP